jgi:hypothetical protein
MTTSDRRLPHPARLPVAACVFSIVVLLGTLAAAPASARFAHPGPAPRDASFEGDEFEEGEEEIVEETEEELEFEVDGEGEWVELESEPGAEEVEGTILPPECLVRSVHPRATVDPSREVLRLALTYSSRSSTRIEASFRLRGARGTLQLAGTTWRPTRSGTLRLNRHLEPGALDKAQAAHEVLVRLDVPETPFYCHVTMRLVSRHAADGRPTRFAPLGRRGRA